MLVATRIVEHKAETGSPGKHRQDGLYRLRNQTDAAASIKGGEM